MDLRAFRGGSDFTVSVDGELFRLHKFPLYAKCAYFKELEQDTECAAGQAGPERVEILDFPGGAPAFALAADFCYNIDIDINRDNLARLCVASEYLQMTGHANLVEVMMGYLHTQGFTTDSEAALGLLVECLQLWPLVGKVKILEKLLTIVTSNFDNYAQLTELPLDWFVRCVVAARGKGSPEALLTQVLVTYLLTWLDNPANLAYPEEVELYMNTIVELIHSVEGLDPTDLFRILLVAHQYNCSCKAALLSWLQI